MSLWRGQREHLRNVGGIVLQIAVRRDDELSTGVREAGGNAAVCPKLREN
jgi:hypothetical protein